MDSHLPTEIPALADARLLIAIPADGSPPIAVCSKSRLDLDRVLTAAGIDPADCSIGTARLATADIVADWDRTTHQAFG